MATLVLDRSNLELRAEPAALAVYENGQRGATVPLKLVERVVMQGSIRVETGIFAKLAEAGASVLMLSPRHARRVAIVHGLAHNDAAIRLGHYRAALDEAFRAGFARDIVRAKLRAQANFLQRALETRPDQRHALLDAGDTVRAILGRIQRDMPDIESLRGHEGAASAAAFRGYQALFPDTLGFTGRNRRPPRDPVNAALSLGYTLLHFDAVRAAHLAGLDPMLGFYHGIAHARESLACDLIEPLRPRIDRWVWRLFAERELRAEHFSMDGQACLMGKTARAHFYASYETAAGPWRRALRRHCAALVRALRASQPVVCACEDEA
jgi:CRISPR-associated protein Cas1